MDGQTDRQRDGQMDRQTDRHTSMALHILPETTILYRPHYLTSHHWRYITPLPNQLNISMSHKIDRFPIRGFLSPFCSWQLIYWSRATGCAINMSFSTSRFTALTWQGSAVQPAGARLSSRCHSPVMYDQAAATSADHCGRQNTVIITTITQKLYRA